MPSSGRLFLEETYLDTLTRKRDVQCTAGKLDRGKTMCFVFRCFVCNSCLCFALGLSPCGDNCIMRDAHCPGSYAKDCLCPFVP